MTEEQKQLATDLLMTLKDDEELDILIHNLKMLWKVMPAAVDIAASITGRKQ
jgi:hypothetical protein